jgi:hypothetical protein
VRRRELTLLLGGAMTASRVLRAHQKAMPVIGFLSGSSPGPAAPFVAGVRQRLSETGYVEGSESGDRIPLGHWQPISSAATSI